MRVPLILAVCALPLLAVPASAQSDDEAAVDGIADELSDPATQEMAGAMAEAMTRVMLNMPVGPMLRAAAEISGEDPEDIDPETTVADMAGDDMAEMPAEIAERVPQMMGAMAGMAGAMEAMLPQLRAMAETMADAMPRAE